ncbi:MAG: IS110 family transposase [Spongiibacteraceae bacterium]|nr:IS110 family transposase [Spongiibacteraceae bacterium]
MKLKTLAIDLAKNTFYLVGFDDDNRPSWRKKLSRQQLEIFVARQEPSLIAMEACASAHHWARRFRHYGHQVKLLPPQHVKAYLRGQKNDFNDAQAIGEASIHSATRSVAVKTVEQQDAQAFHRIRRQLMGEQTRIINQLRGLLGEYGIAIASGIHQASKAIPLILEDAENGLTPRLREMVYRQYQRYTALRAELVWYDQQLDFAAKVDPDIKRLQDVPGFGPINASVLCSWLGDGTQFSRARDASAALGVIPRQHTTGGRDRLFGITKRGDSYVRTLIVHGARAVVSRAKGKTDKLSLWINQLVERRGFNKAAIALANKMIRIAWVLVTRGERYKPALSM